MRLRLHSIVVILRRSTFSRSASAAYQLCHVTSSTFFQKFPLPTVYQGCSSGGPIMVMNGIPNSLPPDLSHMVVDGSGGIDLAIGKMQWSLNTGRSHRSERKTHQYLGKS